MKEILSHGWYEGRPRLKVLWDTEQTTWEELKDMKDDYPKLTTHFILENNVTS